MEQTIQNVSCKLGQTQNGDTSHSTHFQKAFNTRGIQKPKISLNLLGRSRQLTNLPSQNSQPHLKNQVGLFEQTGKTRINSNNISNSGDKLQQKTREIANFSSTQVMNISNRQKNIFNAQQTQSTNNVGRGNQRNSQDSCINLLEISNTQNDDIQISQTKAQNWRDFKNKSQPMFEEQGQVRRKIGMQKQIYLKVQAALRQKPTLLDNNLALDSQVIQAAQSRLPLRESYQTQQSKVQQQNDLQTSVLEHSSRRSSSKLNSQPDLDARNMNNQTTIVQNMYLKTHKVGKIKNISQKVQSKDLTKPVLKANNRQSKASKISCHEINSPKAIQSARNVRKSNIFQPRDAQDYTQILINQRISSGSNLKDKNNTLIPQKIQNTRKSAEIKIKNRSGKFCDTHSKQQKKIDKKTIRNKQLFIIEPEPKCHNMSSPDRISDLSTPVVSSPSHQNQLLSSNLDETFLSGTILHDEEEMPTNLLPKNQIKINKANVKHQNHLEIIQNGQLLLPSGDSVTSFGSRNHINFDKGNNLQDQKFQTLKEPMLKLLMSKSNGGMNLVSKEISCDLLSTQAGNLEIGNQKSKQDKNSKQDQTTLQESANNPEINYTRLTSRSKNVQQVTKRLQKTVNSEKKSVENRFDMGENLHVKMHKVGSFQQRMFVKPETKNGPPSSYLAQSTSMAPAGVSEIKTQQDDTFGRACTVDPGLQQTCNIQNYSKADLERLIAKEPHWVHHKKFNLQMANGKNSCMEQSKESVNSCNTEKLMTSETQINQHEKVSEVKLLLKQRQSFQEVKNLELNQEFDEGFSDRDLGEIAEETPTTAISDEFTNKQQKKQTSLAHPHSYLHYSSVAVTPRELGNIQVHDLNQNKNSQCLKAKYSLLNQKMTKKGFQTIQSEQNKQKNLNTSVRTQEQKSLKNYHEQEIGRKQTTLGFWLPNLSNREQTISQQRSQAVIETAKEILQKKGSRCSCPINNLSNDDNFDILCHKGNKSYRNTYNCGNFCKNLTSKCQKDIIKSLIIQHFKGCVNGATDLKQALTLHQLKSPMSLQANFGLIGSKKFLISAQWWQKWTDYVNFTAESMHGERLFQSRTDSQSVQNISFQSQTHEDINESTTFNKNQRSTLPYNHPLLKILLPKEAKLVQQRPEILLKLNLNDSDSDKCSIDDNNLSQDSSEILQIDKIVGGKNLRDKHQNHVLRDPKELAALLLERNFENFDNSLTLQGQETEQSQLFYERPGRMCNQGLLDRNFAHMNVLKNTAVENFDYIVVPLQVWLHLYSWYSADVTICRKLIADPLSSTPTSSTANVDINPTKNKFIQSSDHQNCRQNHLRQSERNHLQPTFIKSSPLSIGTNWLQKSACQRREENLVTPTNLQQTRLQVMDQNQYAPPRFRALLELFPDNLTQLQTQQQIQQAYAVTTQMHFGVGQSSGVTKKSNDTDTRAFKRHGSRQNLAEQDKDDQVDNRSSWPTTDYQEILPTQMRRHQDLSLDFINDMQDEMEEEEYQEEGSSQFLYNQMVEEQTDSNRREMIGQLIENADDQNSQIASQEEMLLDQDTDPSVLAFENHSYISPSKIEQSKHNDGTIQQLRIGLQEASNRAASPYELQQSPESSSTLIQGDNFQNQKLFSVRVNQNQPSSSALTNQQSNFLIKSFELRGSQQNLVSRKGKSHF